MTVTRLRDIPGIGVDVVGDPGFLRLENLDTDIRPPAVALAATRSAVDDDAANSYLPFQGRRSLREAAAAHVGRIAGLRTTPPRSASAWPEVSTASSTRCSPRWSRVRRSSCATRSTRAW